MLRDLVRDGTTIILTTQYLEEADQLADDIVVLDHGRTVAHGTPDELKARIGNDRIDVKVASRRRARRAPPGASSASPSNAPTLRRRAARRHRPDRRGRPPHGGHARARRRRRRRRRPQPPRGHARRRVPRPSPSPARPTDRGRPHRRRGAPHDRHRDARRSTPDRLADARRRALRRWRSWWSDTLVFAGRNIEHIRQIPEKLLDVTMQPLMFVLLFAYVFGGAIAVARRQLPRVHHRRHPHPVARLRADRSGHRDRDRPDRRRDRPVPLAAGVAAVVPAGPLPGRAGRHGAVDRRAARRRAARRLAHPHRRRSRRRRHRCCSCCSPRR